MPSETTVNIIENIAALHAQLAKLELEATRLRELRTTIAEGGKALVEVSQGMLTATTGMQAATESLRDSGMPRAMDHIGAIERRIEQQLSIIDRTVNEKINELRVKTGAAVGDQLAALPGQLAPALGVQISGQIGAISKSVDKSTSVLTERLSSTSAASKQLGASIDQAIQRLTKDLSSEIQGIGQQVQSTKSALARLEGAVNQLEQRQRFLAVLVGLAAASAAAALLSCLLR
jgi:prefoldin subunit 5